MIRKHVKKDGSISYTAQFRVKRGGKTVYSESQTFERERVAKGWLERRRHELSLPGALEKAQGPKGTLADAIGSYTADVQKIGRTKAQVLRTLLGYPITEKDIATLRPHDVVELARQLSAEGRQPQTVNNYLSHLGAVFAVARTAYGYDVDRHVVTDAIDSAKRLGLTARSAKRTRRPTIDELNRLMTHFERVRRGRPSSNPMTSIIAFALFSARRLEEIVSITWKDLEEDHSRVTVRNMKHPGEKEGNDVIVDLPPEALRIIRSMPKADSRIFPYSTDAVGAAFTRAVKVLSVEDLHFHDLRHEGASRLFEMGWTIPQVAAVTGHRSWQSLQRYSHLRQVGDKWAAWAWLDRIAGPLENTEAGEEAS